MISTDSQHTDVNNCTNFFSTILHPHYIFLHLSKFLNPCTFQKIPKISTFFILAAFKISKFLPLSKTLISKSLNSCTFQKLWFERIKILSKFLQLPKTLISKSLNSYTFEISQFLPLPQTLISESLNSCHFQNLSISVAFKITFLQLSKLHSWT